MQKTAAAIAAMQLIELYQRYISPYKGYRCAHAVYHGDVSCSGAIKQSIATHGVIGTLPIVRWRFQDCRQAFKLLNAGESSNQKNNTTAGGGASCANVCTMPCLWLNLNLTLYMLGTTESGFMLQKSVIDDHQVKTRSLHIS